MKSGKRFFIIIMMALFIQSLTLYAQQNPGYTIITGTLAGIGTTGTNVAAGNVISFTNTAKILTQPSQLRYRNKSVKLSFKLDLGDNYVKQANNWNFKVVLGLSYVYSTTPISSPVARTFTITNSDPEMLKYDDALQYFLSMSPPIGVTISTVTITDGANNSIPAGLLKNFINSNLRLMVTLEREYEMDVRLGTSVISNAPATYPVTISGRLVTFSWQPSNVDAYPNYEVQVLKLYNTSDVYKNDIDQLSTTINWDNALRVETQSYKPFVKLTMGEGTGIYIWRVRPVGTYFKGGIANSENYGSWSYSLPTGTTALLSINSLSTQPGVMPYAFYFKDPDEKINWIYSRVFTEGDNYDKANPTGVKTSEGINYADGLQRARQNQKYNSSENTKLITQSIHDYNGRPALNTLPVPVAGGLAGYNYSFVTNNNGVLYTAQMFDEDNTINNPAVVKDNNLSAFSYYSGNVTSSPSNLHVASAEGYPFKRTVYTTDGTNRVAEESGVGKVHALGTQSVGRGRTTRIVYSAPTDDELIRIFGDEAPLAESVIKTITTDQNNVMSITYTSKEGKTIATALSSEYTDNLSAMPQAAVNLTVANSIDQNVNANGKIVSSKRIAVASNSTNLTLGYFNEAITAPGSGCASGNCNFKMRVYIVDLNLGVTYVSDANSGTTAKEDFVVSGGNYAFPAGWAFVQAAGNTNTLAPATLSLSGTGNNQLMLNSGEYIFIKEIFSGNDENYAESVVAAENEKTKPIIDAIADKMREVTGVGTYSAFTQFLVTLKAKVDNYNANQGETTASLLQFLNIDPATLPQNYTFPYASDFSLSDIIAPSNKANNNLQMVTGCCDTMSVPLPKLPFCVTCDGAPDSPTLTTVEDMRQANAAASSSVIMPYGINDFKNNGGWNGLSTTVKLNAVKSLVEREFITPLKNKMAEAGILLWKLAPGFSFESLHFMFSNMLISQYYTGSAIQNTATGAWHPAIPNPAGGYSLAAEQVSLTASTYSYNYDCKKLFEAWTAAMESIGAYESAGNENIVNSFNDADGNNSAQDNADDDDNWEDMSRRQKKKAQKAMKQEVTDFSNTSEGTVTTARQLAITNIIVNFYDIVGYQFAAIIDGAPLPSYFSTTANSIYPDEYLTSFSTSPPGPNKIYLSTSAIQGTIASSTFTYAPYLFELDANAPFGVILQTVSCNSNPVKELYYPYTLKPEWMFKYFVYNVFDNNTSSDFISDANVLIPHQMNIDLNRKYKEPYSYLPSSIQSTVSSAGVCNTPPANVFTVGSTAQAFSYYHLNWTTQEREVFFKSIKGAPRCPTNKGTQAGTNYFKQNPATNAPDLPECDTKANLVSNAIADLDYRISNCFAKKSEIASALTNELVNACYTLVTCKTGTGQITLNEIDKMADNVISTATAQVAAIKSKFTAMTTSNNAVCGSAASVTGTYTDGLCNLPACTQTDCKEIMLYYDMATGLNSLNVIENRTLTVQYYTDCDKKVLDMLWDADFLPDVPVCRPNCTKPPKVWVSPGCTTNTNCQGNNPTYSEGTNCGTGAVYEKYSGTYTIQASQ